MNWTRRTTVWVLVAVFVLGPASPWALAQEPPPAPTEIVSDMTRESPQPRRTDMYDVGAVAATVLKVPGNVLTCTVGGIFGTALFLATLGSAYKASTRVIEEGCV